MSDISGAYICTRLKTVVIPGAFSSLTQIITFLYFSRVRKRVPAVNFFFERPYAVVGD